MIQKGDLFYLPADITLIDNFTVQRWIKLDEHIGSNGRAPSK